MKKLFALLFSFQLIVTPVFAAGNTPGTEEDAYMTTGTGNKKKNGGYDFYVSQISALATSALGTSIMTNCTTFWKVPSLMLLMAGSFAHIASEFMGAKASNEDHKARLKDLEIKQAELIAKGDLAQKAVLEQRLTEEKATLKFLNNRAKWMTAVSVVYTTALGVAIVESIIHNIPTYGPVTNPFYQWFKGECSAGSSGTISWGTLLSAAYGMGAGKLGSGGAISQYGSMLITLLNLAVPAMGKTISKLYSEPIPRIATIGVMLALTATVTSGLYVRAGKAKDNIKKLEKVIAQFKVNTEGAPVGIVTGSDGDGEDDINDPTKVKKSLKPLVEIKKKQCFSLAGGVAVMSEAACAKKLTITKPTFPDGFNLPNMKNVSNLSTDLANAMANGDEAMAGSLAGEIGSYAAKVQAETDALKKQYNEIQKKNNKPIMDFDKSVKDQVAALQGTINDAAKSGNIDLASMAEGANKLDEEASKTSDAPVVTTAAPSAVVDIPVDPMAGMGTEEVIETPAAVASNANQSLDDFESTEQDISKKSETSIFKQVSNRYILNYSKMFETKKSLDEAKPAANP